LIAEVQDLTITYGRIRALDRVSVRFPEGAVGLLGPNGAGKSTLLKALLGFLTPTSGTANVLGFDAVRQPLEVRARIGYMPESEALFPGLDAVGAVALCAELAGMERIEAVSRAHEVLSYVGIGEARYRDVAGYSAGMKARVKLAQALSGDPDLLLLDEPTNGLDPQGRTEMLGLIKDVGSRYGIHVLLSSHLMPDVEEVCAHVVLVNEGRIAVAAPIRELRALTDRQYIVDYRGDAEAFRRALTAAGAEVQAGDSSSRLAAGEVLVRLAAERGTDPVLNAAVAAGGELHKLVVKERTLTEVFVEAVRGPLPRAAGAA
jgi:ABC-2 type transport system ATP-binding protein